MNQLYEALKNMLHLHKMEMEGTLSELPTQKQWQEAIKQAEQAIKQYENEN